MLKTHTAFLHYLGMLTRETGERGNTRDINGVLKDADLGLHSLERHQ